MFQTEHEFTLPMGYLDEDGNLHRDLLKRPDILEKLDHFDEAGRHRTARKALGLEGAVGTLIIMQSGPVRVGRPR